MPMLALLHLAFELPYLAEALHDARGCNRTVRNSVGWIRWTGRMGRCVIRIRTPLKDPQVIEMRIRRMQVGVLKNSRCVGAYVQFSDELEDLDESTGRYCGHVTGNATRLFLRRGPDLTVLLDSESRFAADNPVIFSAQFSILPARLVNERHYVQQQPPAVETGVAMAMQQQLLPAEALTGECPFECQIRNDRRTCKLVSPGWPGVYPRGIRCRVAMESSAGRFRLGGSPEDLYNLMNHTSQEACRSEFCEQEHVQADQQLQSDRDDEDEMMILPASPRPIKKHERKRAKSGRHREGLQLSLEIEADRDEHSARGDRNRGLDDALFWSKSRGGRRGQHHRHRQHQQRSPAHHHHRRLPSSRSYLGSISCVGDYLALLENVDGRLLEIGKFCGEGRVPQIMSRGSNIVVEFHAERDGTIMHDGFHLSIQESEALPTALASSSLQAGSQRDDQPGCDFVYQSWVRSRDSVKSLRSWYPPGTLCSYRFTGRPGERVSVLLKIVRDEEATPSPAVQRNSSNRRSTINETALGGADHCPGNEIAVYNATHSNGSFLMWSFCDATHTDINNLQVPIVSTGSALLVQFYSAAGSYSGQDFTYSVTYKFVKRPAANATKRLISLRPVDLSSLNLGETDTCNCDDFADRIGNFKSWFIVLLVLGVISFVGAIITIIALLVKCAKIRAAENKLLQTPNRSIYYKGSTD
ncbi:uncharacterized protein LOC106638001 [Copidosoma floridanum]|uniref:uncharacterized protein LOC106638001 n=1 Tax=Copidosoma floridanum TaxID=29053 RepID=UPI000C6FC3A7|nr:uncharacterized protein LOC106638001 [Copidosoma floridanum]